MRRMATGHEPQDIMDSIQSDLQESIQVYEPKAQEAWKDDVYILVVGHTGVGKSRLINALFGKNVAKVTDSAVSTDHEPAEHHHLEVNGKRIHIFDTRGFGDKTMDASTLLGKIQKIQSSFDLVLFCHKLYDRVDKSTEKEMQLLATQMRKELLEHMIFVCTWGDLYRVIPEYMILRKIPDAQERNRRIRDKMTKRAGELTDGLRKSLATDTTDTSVINNIPYCIVSGVRTKLPTADNWTDDLWNLIEKRSSEKAQPLMSWYRRNRNKIFIAAGGTGGSIVVGIAAGAALGAIGGTIGFPGLGTVAGAAVGGVAGGVAGGLAGGLTGGVAGGIAGEGGVKPAAHKIVEKVNHKFSKSKKKLDDEIDEGKEPG